MILNKENVKFLYIEDKGEDKTLWVTCEACLDKRIRYAHYYKDETSGSIKQFGWECARLIDDQNRVHKRENAIRYENKLEKNWCTRKWTPTENGNIKINCKNFEILIYKKYDKYRIKITKPDKQVIWGKKIFNTIEEAKKESWNAFYWTLDHAK